jgi:selenocysteine lyase/cysteine desulfurase
MNPHVDSPGRARSARDPTADAGEWDHLAEVTYLNFAAHAALPKSVLDAAQSVVAGLRMRHAVGDSHFFTLTSQVRSLMAGLIGAEAADVTLTTGASGGLALLAQALPWDNGDEILLVRGDFPCHYATWKPLADREGLVLREFDFPGEFLDVEVLVAALSPRTRLVSLSHVRFDDGSLLDVKALSMACRRQGTMIALDVSQSCGALPVDVGLLGADFLVGAGYKYLLGPMGTGFLWSKRELQARFRPMPGNWAMQDVEKFSQLRYASPPASAAMCRWDAAETQTSLNLNIAVWHESLKYVTDVGPARVCAHAQALVDHLFKSLPAPFRVASPLDPARRGAFGCIDAGSTDASRAVHAALKRTRFVVALREGRLRISPYLCSSHADIEAFVTALPRALEESRHDRA